MATSKAKQAQVAERRKKAIQMRLSGLDWTTIADKLGYSGRAAACKDVSRALEANARAAADAAEDMRTLELARLDLLMAGQWSNAMQGDPKATNVILRVMERRARLLGLDETWRGDATNDAISLLGELGRRLGIGGIADGDSGAG